LENLLRNALDAMGGKGKISAAVFKEKNHIRIEVSDTGKGIPSSKFKTVFKPGYSTKKRGWGLGLSLAKRIIETYHSGKIFVSKSIPNEQTTFTIKLPVNHYVGGEPEI
jgi:signal transduction histidine kinase